MESIWDILIPTLAGLITGAAGYIGGRKQRQKDIDSSTIENLDKSLELYKRIIDDLQIRFNKEIEDLRRKIIEKEAQVKELETKLRAYEENE